MKKIILLLSLLLVSTSSVFSLVTQKTNTVNLVLANVADGNFRDFRFQISGYDDQVFDFNYDQSLTGVAASFRLSKPMDGTIYLDVPVTSITINGTNAHFSIVRTNIPPPGTYYGELLSYEANSTNYYRTIAQGTLPVTWSLYLNASNFFARSTNGAAVGQVYVHPNWIDPPWIGTNSGLGSIYATLNMHTTLSNWTDNINTRLTNVTANTNTYATTNWVTNWVIGQAYATGTPLYAENDPIWTNVSASITTNAAQGADAYSWGNHTLAGYLTVSTNRFDEVLIGRPGLTTTNLCGLTGVYTGVVAQAGIGFTSTAPVLAGGLYVAGYTKQNAYGSITMAVAGVTIHSTAAGAVSNWFSVTASATTNVVLSIYGDGASKSDASNVYVRLITNGSLFVADDLYIGDKIYLTNPIAYISDLTIVSNEVDELQTNALRLTGGTMTGALTNQVGVYGNILGTNLNIFANGTNVIISQSSTGTQIQVSSVVESDPSWTAASNSVVYTNDTNYLQGGTNSLLLNGSRAMYGNLNMGGQSITNVASNSIVFNDGVSLTSTKILLYDTLDESTNALDTRAGNLETATNNLNSRLTVFETNVFVNRITGTSAVSGNLSFEGAGVTQTGTTFNFSGAGGSAAGWSGFAATQTVNMASNIFTNVAALYFNLPSGGSLSVTTDEVNNIKIRAANPITMMEGSDVSVMSIAASGVSISTATVDNVLTVNGFLNMANNYVTNATYYGNGIGLTNIPGDLTAAEKATATNALRVDGSKPMLATLNMGGNMITNAGVKIQAKATTAFIVTTPSVIPTAVPFATTVFQQGGTWNGSNWTPGVVGFIEIKAAGKVAVYNDAGLRVITRWIKNDVKKTEKDTPNNLTYWGDTYGDYCESTTNRYALQVFISSGLTWTNDTTVDSYFWGTTVP